MAVMMEGKPVHERIMSWARKETDALKKKKVTPTLAAILTKDDETSKVYVGMKKKDCEMVGIRSEIYEAYKREKDEGYEKRVLALIKQLNEREDVHSILIQLPLSQKLDEEKIFSILSPKKDVDGLTPYNLGKLMRGEYSETSMIPCTPKGVVKLLDYYKVPLEGRDAIVIGRSFLVGEPLRKLLQDRDVTATCLHSKTRNIDEVISSADIVVSAVGRPPELYGNGFRLTSKMLKDDVVVVGVGVRKHSGKMYFDLDVDDVKKKASKVAPNIGGVGLMTRACLIENTINAAKS